MRLRLSVLQGYSSGWGLKREKILLSSWLTERPACLILHDLPIKGPISYYYSFARLLIVNRGWQKIILIPASVTP